MTEDTPIKYVIANKQEAEPFYASIFGETGAGNILKIMEDMNNSSQTGGKQSVMLNIGNEANAEEIYDSLSADGDWFSPKECGSIYTCEFMDKYGVNWILYYNNPNAPEDLL